MPGRGPGRPSGARAACLVGPCALGGSPLASTKKGPPQDQVAPAPAAAAAGLCAGQGLWRLCRAAGQQWLRGLARW